MTKKIAQVAIIKPLHNLFDYEIPQEFVGIEPGTRVLIEFGRKQVLGFVITVKENNNSLKINYTSQGCSHFNKELLEI